MKRLLLLFILCLSLHTNAHGQFRRLGDNSGALSICVMDAGYRRLIGANVTLETGKDVINLVTSGGVLNGYVNYNKHLPDSVWVKISYVGYETLEKKIRSQSSYDVILQEKKTEISEVVVKGDIIAVITKGDTVQYNKTAFKTIEGDSMSEFFKKLPGMTFEGNELKYRGEKIDRVTIDSQRLFGDNVALALDNIKADDVVNVKVYKTDDDWAKENGIKNAEQKTVADVTTKSKPTRIRNVTLVAAAGAETAADNRKPLYEASGKLVYSRVGETFTANAEIKNVNIPNFFVPLRYKMSDAGGGIYYYRDKPKKFLLTTDTKFNRSSDASEQWEQRAYFPSANYTDRDYFSQNLLDNRKMDFSTRNVWWGTFKNRNRLRVTADFVYTDDLKNKTDLSASTQDGVPILSQHIRQRDKSGSYNLNAGLDYSKAFESKIRIGAAVFARISERNGDGWRVDTLATSTSQIYLDNNDSNRERVYTSKVTAEFPFGETTSFRLEDELSYSDNFAERMSVDMLTQTIDSINTFDYKLNELRNTLSGLLVYRDNQKQKGFSEATLNVKWMNRNMQRDEYFPKGYEFPRTFNVVDIDANITYKFTPLNRLNLRYWRAGSYSFNLLDLRPNLDNANPVLLKVGNPDLKIPVNNWLRLEGQFIKNNATYGIVVNYNIYENSIVDKERYFTSNTYLPEFDYTALAGSILSTKENLSGGKLLEIRGSFNKYLRKLQSTINADVLYSYGKNPDYIQERLAEKTSNKYSASIGIRGGFSSVIEPSLSVASEYSDVYNGMVRTKGFTQDMDFNIRSLIAKKVEINCTNKLEWNLRWPEVAYMERFSVLTTVSVGYRFTKGLIAKVTVYDVFDRRSRFSYRTYADYISTSYTRQMGRYVLAGIEWKF